MIINEIALLINNMMNNLYNYNIHFYQIIIALFIFNLIIYYIVKLFQEARKQVYFK